MGLTEDQILQWFSQYAYQPWLVYGAIVVFMFLSSFGVPIPEEITLLSTGLVAYMGSRPDLYPPPYPGAPVVNLYLAAIIATLSVFLSDFLVYFLGRHSGPWLHKIPWLERQLSRMDKVMEWTNRYGKWASGIFRFTPGLRFPGHFACGLLGVTPLQFMAIDGFAVLISVPTQILLIGHYGHDILESLKTGKIYLLAALSVVALLFLGRWVYRRFRRKH